MEFVEGKGLEADSMSLDFGMKKVVEPEVADADAESETATEDEGSELETTE
jgi:hypothetical protein